MFRYTKKIVIAASLLAFFSGHLYAMNPDGTDVKDEQRKVIVTKLLGDNSKEMPIDIVEDIVVKAIKRGADPRVLKRLNKEWSYFFKKNKGKKIAVFMDIPYTTQTRNFLMEDYMRLYREGLVSRATLIYKRGQIGEERAIKFSDFKDGRAVLTDCGDEAGSQVYTDSRECFLEVRGANENKLVTFIGPLHMVQDLLPKQAGGNAADESEGAASSVVGLWRYGNWNLEYGFDYAAHASPADWAIYNLADIREGKRAAGSERGGARNRIIPYFGEEASDRVFHVGL